MFFAGHCPTRRFTLAEWQAMPVFMGRELEEGYFPPLGCSRSIDSRGKPVVLVIPEDDWRMGHAVRPVVRVPMRKAA